MRKIVAFFLLISGSVSSFANGSGAQVDIPVVSCAVSDDEIVLLVTGFLEAKHHSGKNREEAEKAMADCPRMLALAEADARGDQPESLGFDEEQAERLGLCRLFADFSAVPDINPETLARLLAFLGNEPIDPEERSFVEPMQEIELQMHAMMDSEIIAQYPGWATVRSGFVKEWRAACRLRENLLP